MLYTFHFLQRWEIKNCWALLCLPVSLKTFISGGSSHQHDILQRINSCLFGHFCNLCIQTKIRKLWMFLYWKSRKINWCASSSCAADICRCWRHLCHPRQTYQWMNSSNLRVLLYYKVHSPSVPYLGYIGSLKLFFFSFSSDLFIRNCTVCKQSKILVAFKFISVQEATDSLQCCGVSSSTWRTPV